MFSWSRTKTAMCAVRGEPVEPPTDNSASGTPNAWRDNALRPRSRRTARADDRLGRASVPRGAGVGTGLPAAGGVLRGDDGSARGVAAAADGGAAVPGRGGGANAA